MADCPADSPLSTTGNIIGILTFALGVASFLAALYAITHNAPDEIKDYQKSLGDREVHIQKIKDYFDEADKYADSQLEGNPMKDVIDSILTDLEDRRGKMKEVIDSVNGRLQWWYRRQDKSGDVVFQEEGAAVNCAIAVAVAMARVENQLQYLSALQSTFLLLKIKRQAGQLDDIEGDIRDLKVALAKVVPRA